MKRLILIGLAAVVFVGLGIQLIRPSQVNPPVTSEPKWDSPQTRALAQRACFDCHSNQTTWPWYSKIAPASWWITNHVNEGREKLNFSAVDGSEEAEEMVEEIAKGEMPLWDYLLAHPTARLSPTEKDSLVAGLNRTFGGNEDGAEGIADSTGKIPAEAGEGGGKKHDDDDD